MKPPSSTSLANLPVAMAELQNQVETLYSAKNRLEQELRILRAAPPILMTPPSKNNAVWRAIFRVSPTLRRRHHLRIIRSCGLFDSDWYLKKYTDVAENGADPATHYFNHGARENRNPGPHFNTHHYLKLYSDIENAGINPLVHYVLAGRFENRSIRPGMPHGHN